MTMPQGDGKLRVGEACYRALIELSTDGIILESEAGTILDCNPVACQIYGYSKEELVGQKSSILYPPAEDGRPRNTIVTDGVPTELVGVRRDGSTFPVEVSTRLYEIDEERRLVNYSRDISSQKRALRLLADKSEIMESIGRDRPLGEVLDQLVYAMEVQLPDARSSIMLLRDDRLWTISAPNLPETYTRRIDGLLLEADDYQAFLGTTVYVSDIGADPNWRSYRDLALAHGLRSSWSHPILGNNGDLLGAFVNYYDEVRSPTTGEVQAVEQLASLAGIAIERTRSSTALKVSERRFRALVESIQEVVVIMDRDGRTRYVSPAVQKVTGYQIEERVGRNAFELVHPEDFDFVHSRYLELLAKPGSRELGEIRIQHKDGSWRRVELIGQNLLHDTFVKGIVVTYQDITERRRLEEQLHVSQKLEAVGRLAGGVAHDFNNLLNIIGGIVHLSIPTVSTGSALHEDLLEIIAAVEQGANLTQQLLAFSRKQLLQPRILDLRSEITGVTSMLRRVIGEDVELVTRLYSYSNVKADPGQISQLLMNLAVNARDAMPDGGTLTITTRDIGRWSKDSGRGRAPDSANGQDNFVEIVIQDSGAGMDPETLAHIFEPFYTTKAPGKGTGLGLSTVYGIVRQCGGQIEAESIPGEGTRFRILLPTTGTAPHPDDVARTPLLESRGETILLVEDAPAMRTVVRRILEKNGYHVLEAASGTAALRLAEEHGEEIDLVLTDIVMPGISGTRVAQELRQACPNLPIIYMSGYTDDQMIDRELSQPHTYFLQKPFAPDHLVQAVRDRLEERERQGVTGR